MISQASAVSSGSSVFMDSSEEDIFLANINLTQLTEDNQPPSGPSQVNLSISSSPSYSPLPLSPLFTTNMDEGNLAAEMSTHQTLLEELDSEKSLSVWELMNDYDSDSLVREYFQILSDVKIRPSIPDVTVLNTLPVPDFELPIQIQSSILNHFTCYFQCRYSALNINAAVQNDVCLFSPFIHFKIPQFELLPEKYYKESKEAKELFVKAIQLNAVNGISFTIELILLRIYKEILLHVRTVVLAEAAQKQTMQQFFLSFYKAAQTNFHQKFKIKNIDWNTKESRVKDGMPRWRKMGTDPPAVRTSRYVKELTKKVNEGKVKITSLGIIRQNNSQQPTSTIPSNNSPANNTNSAPAHQITSTVQNPSTHNIQGQGQNKNASKLRGSRMTVKDFTKGKLEKHKKRNMMETFNKQRNLNSDEDNSDIHHEAPILIN